MISVMQFVAAGFLLCSVLENMQVNGNPVRADEEIAALKKAQEICIKKSGVSDKIYNTAKNDNNMDITDRNLQCYTACILETMQVMDEKNKIDVTPVIELLSEENKAAHADHLMSCQNEVDDSDKCKKGILFYECMKNKTGPSWYFI